MRVAAVAILLILTFSLPGCVGTVVAGPISGARGPELSDSASPNASTPSIPEAVFISVVDGDTIETSAGTVRIIGIDTPERGECGDQEASEAIAKVLTSGDPVVLTLPTGQNDHDKYGRLIRYVTTDAGLDLGLMQLQAGNAVARYDSLDGYPAHPHESDYRAGQRASIGPNGSVVTVACRESPPAAPAPGGSWWEQYTSCTKLKKNTAGHPTGPFSRDDPSQAEPYDWFANRTGNGGDGDGDGLACE